jgi:tripartite-type tricarboxylate transporter receptor subunit TctC
MTLGRRAVLAAAALPAAGRAQGQAPAATDWPNRAVTVVNPWPAGGSSDSVTRILFQQVAADLGQPFVVENRPGATGTLGHAAVARARPDGHTLLLGTNSTYAIAPHLYPSMPYAPEALIGVSLIATNPQMLCVHPSVAAPDLRTLIALAKAQPEGLTFASSGIGGTSHLATELFMSMADIRMLHVPYRGGGPAAQALLAGEVQVTFVDIITALPFLRGGQLRGLGSSGTHRAPLAPEIAPIGEVGLPGFQSSTDFALLAPAGLPGPILARLHAACAVALRSAAVAEKLANAGIEPVGAPPEAWPAYAAAESAKWGAIIRARGIRAA